MKKCSTFAIYGTAASLKAVNSLWWKLIFLSLAAVDHRQIYKKKKFTKAIKLWMSQEVKLTFTLCSHIDYIEVCSELKKSCKFTRRTQLIVQQIFLVILSRVQWIFNLFNTLAWLARYTLCNDINVVNIVWRIMIWYQKINLMQISFKRRNNY